ncbi:MAG: acyltransferase [Desulfovibrio sp.]|nr:acyltransferase [Desulfovibrio sp.]
MPEKGQYPGLDAMKFLMAGMVVLLHTSPVFDAPLPNLLVREGLARVAVPFFFIASGYLLFGRMSAGEVDLGRVRRYVLRIMRVYAVWVIIYLPFILQIYGRDIEIYGGLAGWVWYFFMPGYMHLWFLAALVLAIMLLAALRRKGWGFRRILLLGFCLYLPALWGCAYYGAFAAMFPQFLHDEALMKSLYILFGNPRNGLTMGFFYVSLGAALAARRPRLGKRVLLSLSGIALLFLLAEIALVDSLGWLRDGDASLCLVPAAVSVFLLSLKLRLPWLRTELFLWLRKLSMLVYCLHFAFFLLLLHGPWPAARSGPALFLLTAAASLSVAAVIVLLGRRIRFLRWLM